ncbi:MAG: flagellar basal body L-ring protein FlgH [Nitrospirae bacterium]|nr:flagellar basal body L-ring protein FlgH [Nitrospirota bacterium]
MKIQLESICKTENRAQRTEHRLQKNGVAAVYCCLLSVICVLCSGLFALFFVGCVSPSAKLPPPPPKYIDNAQDVAGHYSLNSLWSDSGNLFEDGKARRLNDLVTINIVESLSGSGKADTDTSSESTLDFELTKLLGMNTDFGLQNRSLLKHLFEGGKVFEPAVKSTSKSEFKGKGDTNREGKLIATVTAKVVEVMPNGNLVLEARKELTINNEKQILVLSGMARPDDISSDNTIFSNKLADAQVYYLGDGVIQDKQGPGWMARILDNIWPF